LSNVFPFGLLITLSEQHTNQRAGHRHPRRGASYAVPLDWSSPHDISAQCSAFKPFPYAPQESWHFFEVLWPFGHSRNDVVRDRVCLEHRAKVGNRAT
jgi:hypothetical protein